MVRISTIPSYFFCASAIPHFHLWNLMCVTTARSCWFKFQFFLDNFIPNVNSWKTRQNTENGEHIRTLQYLSPLDMAHGLRCVLYFLPLDVFLVHFGHPRAIPPGSAIKSQVFRERVGFVVLCIIGAYCSMRRGTSIWLPTRSTFHLPQHKIFPDPMGTVPAFFLVIFFAVCSILFHNFHSVS